MKVLVLLPFHLGEDISGYDEVVIYEEPLLYAGQHQLKCAYLRAISLATKLTIVDEEWLKTNARDVAMYDALDYRIQDKLDSFAAANQIQWTWLELKESFMLQAPKLESLYLHFKDHQWVSHGNFFKMVKKEFSILVDVESTDAENRRKLPVKHVVPKDYVDSNDLEIKREAIEWARSRFGGQVGSPDVLLELPITKQAANEYFEQFLRVRLMNYGTYQDAVRAKEVKLYHSHCSYLINTGLLSPTKVIKSVMQHSSRVPMNSTEGFVRQLLGWREFMRFIYRFWGRKMKKELENIPGEELDWQAWTQGTTGYLPIDVEIKKVWKHAWSHHIVRLMFFLNLMKLLKIRPLHIYDWFSRFVSLDAYEWVMVSNIGAMGYFTAKPRFMRKEYVSSPAYLLRMSDYPKGPWCDKWPKVAIQQLQYRRPKLK